MAGLVITPEIEADARRLAEATNTSPTEAVAQALRAKLQLLPSKPPAEKASMEELMALVAKIQDGPIDWSLTDDEILGYDEDGIPEQPYLGR